MPRLIFGCLLCGLLAACGNSNYGPTETTVHPLLQAELQRIESFPATPIMQVPSGGGTCTKRAVSGTPPEVVLSGIRDKLDPSIGFVISDGPDTAVLLMNLAGELPNSRIELWQLASLQDLRLIRKIPLQISPDESSWGSRFLKEVVCLPNGRALVAINYWIEGLAQADLFLYDIERRRFSKFFDNYETRFSDVYESQRLNADAAIVLHFSDSKRLAAELYFNFYNRFNLFTRAHPDGIEALKLGIDTGNVKEWKVIDKTLYLRTHNPLTSSQVPDAYWSLNLSKLLTD